MRQTVRALVAVAMVAAVVSTGSAVAPGGETATYVVVLKPGAADVAATAGQLAQAHGGQVGFVYQHALNGFSIQISAKGVAALARNPQVAYVEADQEFAVVAQTVPTGVSRIFADANSNIGIDGTDDLRVDVDVAVIDTGIDLDHPDLNVVASTNCSGGSPFKRSCGSGGNDGNGHGTHVAGTIGAIDNDAGVVGVAPGARLWAVKVLSDSGSGYTTWILAGLDYVVDNASQIEVGNMSLGGGFSQALNDGVAGAVSAGVTMVVAAGNSAANAANSSPASEPSAITVSALADFNGLPDGGAPATCRADVDDTFADFSNFGSVIDIIAPGVCILSTVPGGYDTFSGTSMASPHVAGAAALLASGASTLTPSQINTTLRNNGNSGWNNSDDGDSTKEPLLDVSNATVFNPAMVAGSGGGGEEPPANEPPTGAFTFSCTDLTCSFNGSGSSDPDGTIVSYAWSFGDGSAGSGATVQKTYTSGGTYPVMLTVTDDDNATGSVSQDVTVSASTGGITVTGSATNNGSSWTATVTVSGLGAGGSITGSWNIGGTPNGCTAPSGSTSCTFSRSGIPKRTGSATWTATGGSPSITISKP